MYTDLAGNVNVESNTFEWTYDTTSPTITITAAEGSSGFISNDASIRLTFTPSESTIDFTSEDVTVTGGGTLSSFTGSGTTYTATLTPSTEGLQSIKVAANAYSDLAGNSNDNVESNIFEWTYDVSSPTITITAAEGSSGFISNDASIRLTFTLSESTSDFTSEDVTVTGGGTLSSFTGSGTTYTATLTPSTEGLQSIKVAANAYSDSAGNVNVESNTFEWTYDTTSPTITLTVAEGFSGFTSNDASISLTFTLSESTSDFTSEDVTVTGGGTLSSFTGSGTTYTATLTPSTEGQQSIKVASGVYTDLAGNVNVESNTFEWTYDTTSPTITITAAEGSSGFISNDASIRLTFTPSESTIDFTSEDVTVTGGGTLSSFTGSGTTYTATLTPSTEGLQSIKVAANAYSDLAGNSNDNVESNIFEWTYDVSSPTITITAAEGSSGFISNDASIRLTFTLSESTSDFTSEDVTVTGGGTLSSFTGSGTTYTATLTPSTEGLQSIKVASGVYTDAAGNVNVESNTFEWTYDTTSPTITITAAEGSSGFISNDASISLTFTLSESTSDFTYEDVPVTGVETPGLLSTSSEFTSDFTSSYVTIIGGGTLSSFTGSGTTYTATLTPSTEGLQSIKVASGVYTDAAGNVNVESNTFEWTYDTTSPTIMLTAAEGSSSFISNDASIRLTFTLSESTSDFTSEDVTVTGGGTLSSFTGSGTTYTATLTPSTEGLQSIKVASGVYTDAAGNVNVESNTFEWTYDVTSPTITLTAAEGSSGFISNDASISLTFTLSESTSDFTYEDVPVTGVETPGLLSTSSEFTSDFTSSYVTIIGGGTLSSFTGSGTTYTATLHAFHRRASID